MGPVSIEYAVAESGRCQLEENNGMRENIFTLLMFSLDYNKMV